MAGALSALGKFAGGPWGAAAGAGLGLLGGLFAPNRNKELRKLRKEIDFMSTPEQMLKEKDKFASGIMAGPGFTSALRDLGNAGAAASSAAASQSAGSGITGGIAAAGQSAAAAVPGVQTAQLRGQVDMEAMQTALKNIEMKMNTLNNLGQGVPDTQRNMFAALLGSLPKLMGGMSGIKRTSLDPYGSRGSDFSESLMQMGR